MPQTNGEAERAVQTIKNAIKEEKDPAKALMSYRATPLENGYRPAEMLFKRTIRTTVPVFPDQLKPSWLGLQELREHEQESKIVQTKRYNVNHRCTELPALKPGVHVWVVDQKKPAVVTERATTTRSYAVVTQDGNQIRRNRRHLWSPCHRQSNRSSLRKRRQPHQLYHHRSVDPQIAKHHSMMSKLPDLDGWLGR